MTVLAATVLAIECANERVHRPPEPDERRYNRQDATGAELLVGPLSCQDEDQKAHRQLDPEPGIAHRPGTLSAARIWGFHAENLVPCEIFRKRIRH